MDFLKIIKSKVKNSKKKTIILPENNDERIIEASKKIIEDNLCNIAFIDKSPLKNVKIINKKKYIEKFANSYYNLRKEKGITFNQSLKTINDNTYFATMCVFNNIVDGMVSGATHTTADTIRPAFQIIKTSKNVSIVSSSFFMIFEDKIMVFADCAVNPNPTGEQLAEIAQSTMKTAQIIHHINDIKLAFISYSSGNSGIGKDVELVKSATKIFQKNMPNVISDGPLQYDSAVNNNIGKQKMPNSKVAGKANVLIFPDLNTGNAVYKAVQQTGNILAVGPILQGLNKPINDLSRGTTIDDIYNTILITSLL